MAAKLPGAICDQCPLRSNKVVPPEGSLEAELIVVGDVPGVSEAIQGRPFVGKTLQLLNAALQQAGIEDPSNQVFYTNAIACRPPYTQDQELMLAKATRCCAPRLIQELNGVKATKVLAMGNTTHDAFGVPSNQKGALYDIWNKVVMPAWHPSYVLRDPDNADDFLEEVQQLVRGEGKVDAISFPEIVWIKNASHLKIVLDSCDDGSWVSFDIETDQTQWFDTPSTPADQILMLQLCWNQDTAYIIGDDLLYDDPHVVQLLKEFFPRVLTVGQNAKFDAVFLEGQLGIHVHQTFDTMLAHYALNENLSHGLKEMARLEFGVPDYEEATIAPYLTSKNDRYSKVPTEILAKYGGMDVKMVLLLRPILEARLIEQGLYDYPFQNILMPAANALTQVELRGFLVDIPQLDSISESFQQEIDVLVQQARDCVGMPNLNLNSPTQLAEVIYDKLHLPIVKGRKLKPRSTAHGALDQLRGKHPLIDILGQYRRIAKMRSSYVENLRGYADVNGRIHGSFKIPGTEVSRLAIRDPALQTIPRASEYFGAMIRSAFIAKPGHVLIVTDYSQAELRAIACASGEQFLINVYRNGRDLHTEVARAMYGDTYTKEQRVMCKMFNFSYVYGGNEYSFAQDQGLKIEVAKQFVKDYNTNMPDLLKYRGAQFRKLKEDGFVQTIFGRRRHFPIITSENEDDARKACVHMPTASTASDLTLMSAIKMEQMGIPVVLTVHDSVIAEVPEAQAETTGNLMMSIMSEMGQRFLPQVPWEADKDISVRWAKPLPHP